jgi:hypothetical protein
MSKLRVSKEDVNNHFAGHWEDFYLRLLPDAKKGGGREFYHLCPFHHEKSPSFFFNGDSGLVNCHGCGWGGDPFTFYGKLKNISSFPEILQGITEEFHLNGSGPTTAGNPTTKKASPKKLKPWNDARPILMEHDYTDAEGNLLFQVVRFATKPKTLPRCKISGKWHTGVETDKRPLYRLREIAGAGELCITEGEKDADNLVKLGFQATCPPFGAWRDEHKAALRGKDVFIFWDNDDAGAAKRDKAVAFLRGVAKSIRIVDLPTEGKPKGYDVSDFIAEFDEPEAAKEKLSIMMSDSREPEAKGEAVNNRVGLDACSVSFEALLGMEIPEREKLFDFLPEGGIAMIFGPRGIGKTYFTLSMAVSLSTGAAFFKWGEPMKRVGVLIVDGEMALYDLRERLKALMVQFPTEPLNVISSEVAFSRMERDINLVDGDQQGDLISILDGNKAIRLVIIDNISCLFSGLRESSKDDWEQVVPWLLALRRRGVAVVLVHHAGKGGDQRGTSGREDMLDTVIRLDPVTGTMNEGARFVVSFTKCRGAYGDAVKSFEATLDLDSDHKWTWKPIEESNYQRMLALAEDGISSVTDMAEELGLSKGMVSRLKKKGQDRGDLKKGTTISLVDDKAGFE